MTTGQPRGDSRPSERQDAVGPKASVIMPMRNAAAFVDDALSSILEGTETPVEVLVVDDGSTDQSAAIVRRRGDGRIKVIPGPQRGVASAFNAGLDEARGTYVFRCDADDLYVRGRIDRQVAWLDENPQYSAVCGGFTMVDDRGKVRAELSGDLAPEDITMELKGGTTRTHHCTWAVRAEALRAAGGCRTYFETAEDVDLQFRLAFTGGVMYLPGSLYLYRVHDASVTHQSASTRLQFFELQARRFAMQRLRDGSDDLDRGLAPSAPRIDETSGRGRDAEEHLQGVLLGLSWREHGAGRRRSALGLGWHAVRINPSNLTAWRSLLMLTLKRRKR